VQTSGCGTKSRMAAASTLFSRPESHWKLLAHA
jgi:hypothetical protein